MGAMLDRYTVETPENVELRYEVAGIGSRFLAAIVDSALIIFGQALVLYPIGLLAGVTDFSESVVVAVGAALSFAIVWGYYIVFELLWSGQSPGKRLFGLRVLREGGRPIGFLAAATRNVVRLVDFLPALYGVGVVVMFVDRRARRLGDFAAGTLVVRERGEVTLASLALPAEPPPSAPTLAGVALVTARDYALVSEFLERRAELGGDVRRRVAELLAAGLQARLGIPQGGDAERFLQYVAREYRANQRSLRAPRD
jgi:uncharacterized RDD family membrane protein YckC